MLWRKKVVNWKPTTAMIDKARVKLYNQFFSARRDLYDNNKAEYFHQERIYVEVEFYKLRYNQKSLEKFLKR